MGARKHRGTKDLPWDTVVRERIRAANIESRLLKAFNGTIELTPTQKDIGIALLRKISPDLSSTEISGELDTKPRVVSGKPLSDVDWEAKYAMALSEMPTPAKSNGNGTGH